MRTDWFCCYFMVFMGCALAGCGLARNAELEKRLAEADRTRAAEEAKCDQAHPQPRPVTPRMQCTSTAYLNWLESTGNPNLTLFRASIAQRLVIAERYDKGQISEAEYNAEAAKLDLAADTAIRQRNESAAMVSAAQQQASAASGQAALARQKAISDAFRGNRTTCSTWGNTTTCY